MTNTSPTAKTVAALIINQLGDRRFMVMTGAKNFTFGTDKAGNDYLQFSLPKTAHFVKNKADTVRITLDKSDTYTATFSKTASIAKIRSQILKGEEVEGFKLISEHAGIYADMLREVFTEETGLETALSRMAA